MQRRTHARTFRIFRYHCRIELTILIFFCILYGIWRVRAKDDHNVILGDVVATSSTTPSIDFPFDQCSEPIVFKLDLNEASNAELSLLPRIGPALSKKISDYRDEIGFFQNVDELLNVKGIGPKTLAKIRPFCQITDADVSSTDDRPHSDPTQQD